MARFFGRFINGANAIQFNFDTNTKKYLNKKKAPHDVFWGSPKIVRGEGLIAFSPEAVGNQYFGVKLYSHFSKMNVECEVVATGVEPCLTWTLFELYFVVVAEGDFHLLTAVFDFVKDFNLPRYGQMHHWVNARLFGEKRYF